jgi:hypothetical protein
VLAVRKVQVAQEITGLVVLVVRLMWVLLMCSEVVAALAA